MGIALFGSIGVAIYRGLLASALPVGLSADSSRAALATLAGAVNVAQQLPPERAVALVGAAREAFLRGLVVCQVISGVMTLVLATFAWAMFRRVGVSSEKT